LQELLLLNLNVSFEELQLFAGKEGIEDARRVYPFLQRWYQSRDSRQAIWHAGQILRAARLMPPEHLRDFFAIVVYHASLTFWVFGILGIRNKSSHVHQSILKSTKPEIVILDGERAPEKFIAGGRGNPAISSFVGIGGEVKLVFLDDLTTVMEILIAVLHQNEEWDTMPPLVENLSRLMKDLGNAAGKVRREKNRAAD